LFAFSLLLPAVIPWLQNMPGPISGWWLSWIIRALAIGGFTEIETPHGDVYLRHAPYIAVVFWAVGGFLYAFATRPFRLRYVVLAAYPTMFVMLAAATAVIRLLGYQQQWSL
jgi:hypothetical protein